MASGKKRRKEIKQTKLRQQPAGPRKVRDGDRRHREGMAKLIKDALLRKKLQQLEGLPVEEPEEEE